MELNVDELHPAANANKYSRGKLVLVAGSARYPGAAILAARASQRMGAGYTEVVTDARAVDAVRAASPSLVVRPFEEWDAKGHLPAYREGRPCAVCVGPGFTGDAQGTGLVSRVLKRASCPVVVDGGGLAGLASAPKNLRRLAKRAASGHATVVTPHGGEAARLAAALGLDAGDPEKLAAALAEALHAIVVLKGPDTFISDGQRAETMTEGTPALAKAGTGDVLAGMLGALLAQGFDPFHSAVLAARLHAEAGRAAAERFTDIAVCAEDVIEAIPEVLR